MSVPRDNLKVLPPTGQTPFSNPKKYTSYSINKYKHYDKRGCDKLQKISKQQFEFLKKTAEDNDPEALFDLSICYRYGFRVKINNKKSFKYATKAAIQGLLAAEGVLGDYYTLEGFLDLPLDECRKKAMEVYKIAAQRNSTNAQHSLAKMYEEDEDLETAFAWYKKAADLGYAYAQRSLALCYSENWGVPENEQDNYLVFSNKYYELAEAQGLSRPMSESDESEPYSPSGSDSSDDEHIKKFTDFNDTYTSVFKEDPLNISRRELLAKLTPDQIKNLQSVASRVGARESVLLDLGLCYLLGYAGITIDKQKAFRLIERAAKKNSTMALYFLGEIYLSDTPLQNESKTAKESKESHEKLALDCYQQAADQGLAIASYTIIKKFPQQAKSIVDKKLQASRGKEAQSPIKVDSVEYFMNAELEIVASNASKKDSPSSPMVAVSHQPLLRATGLSESTSISQHLSVSVEKKINKDDIEAKEKKEIKDASEASLVSKTKEADIVIMKAHEERNRLQLKIVGLQKLISKRFEKFDLNKQEIQSLQAEILDCTKTEIDQGSMPSIMDCSEDSHDKVDQLKELAFELSFGKNTLSVSPSLPVLKQSKDNIAYQKEQILIQNEILATQESTLLHMLTNIDLHKREIAIQEDTLAILTKDIMNQQTMIFSLQDKKATVQEDFHGEKRKFEEGEESEVKRRRVESKGP